MVPLSDCPVGLRLQKEVCPGSAAQPDKFTLRGLHLTCISISNWWLRIRPLENRVAVGRWLQGQNALLAHDADAWAPYIRRNSRHDSVAPADYGPGLLLCQICVDAFRASVLNCAPSNCSTVIETSPLTPVSRWRTTPDLPVNLPRMMTH